MGEASAFAGVRARAFTLIELLIVIAIILILLAIALPNFLEAMTRAKVTRASTELRTLGVAIQSYAIDHRAYPLAAGEEGHPIVPYPPVGFGPEVFDTRLDTTITTPVAYITAIPHDPFASNTPDSDDPRVLEAPTYHYGSHDYAEANDGPEGVAKFKEFVRILRASPDSILFYVASHGPDYDHDDDEVPEDPEAAAPYSPTNGSRSSGDIVYMGPGHGFVK